MSGIPADVRARLANEYPGASYEEALRLVESLGVGPRVLRSVVFLAEGELEQLRRYAQCASEDWRDVIFWAEYEDHGAKTPRHVRSMTEPFEST